MAIKFNFTLNLRIPESWNELTEKQLEEISFALDYYHRFIDLHPAELREEYHYKLYVRLVKNLIRENNFIKVWIVLRQLPPEEYQDYVQFLIKGVTRTKFLKPFLLEGKMYYPPMDRLQNITIEEFGYLDTAYYYWRTTKQEKYLNILCATLYRRSSFKTFLKIYPKNEKDIRKAFDKIYVGPAVSKFRKLDIKKRVAIGTIYEGCRAAVAKLYPHVFPKPPERSPEDKTPAAKPIYTPFGQLITNKIKYDTSKLKSTQALNIHEFLSVYENELSQDKN
jgi:hypothetical protein